MKIESIEIGATIPVQQYGNIQPKITLSSPDEGEDLISAGISIVEKLFSTYSEKGGLSKKEMVSSLVLKEKSFNEDIEIDYDEVNHKYFYKDELFNGVTNEIKKYYKDFDAEIISSVLEKSWGVPQDVIKELWNTNSELTSLLGKTVHKAIENYEKLNGIGEIIQNKKEDEENYALPKHPLLKHIVQSFLNIRQEYGEVKTEVLLTSVENKLCGRADRIAIIDSEKKICRVEDLKININAEEEDKNLKVISDIKVLKELPKTKLSKYQIQLSMYANMLQKSGWTVEGLDVYVYEDEWKHYTLEVLNIL